MSEKRKALGRGLAALIPGAASSDAVVVEAGGGARAVSPVSATAGNGLRTVAIEEVHPCRQQPRKNFHDGRLGELAESIRTQGIIAPLVVRLRPQGGFELIAGERRWRAAQRAGLHEVPIVVRDVAETRAFEMALVENLQREDLNPIEEAEGYERLVKELGYTQESLATRVSKERSTIANALRLLRLPASVREMVIDGRLGMGHARALLSLESNAAIERVARTTVARGLSVRQVELLVRREHAGKTAPPPAAAKPSAAVRDLTLRLQRALGAKVKIVEAAGGKGHIEVHYGSLDELDGVLGRIFRG